MEFPYCVRHVVLLCIDINVSSEYSCGVVALAFFRGLVTYILKFLSFVDIVVVVIAIVISHA